MGAVQPPSVTRMLTDEYDLYYDRMDLFTSALEHKQLEPFPWMCGSNRTLHVGDAIYVLEGSYHCWPELEKDCTEDFPARGLVARGQLVAEKAAHQLRLLDRAAFGDLSAAYSDGIWEELPEERDPILYVCVDFDSMVDLEHRLPIAWLQEQPGCHDLFRDAPYSGALIPPQIVPLLHAYWERHVRQREAAGFGVRLRQGSDRMKGPSEVESVD